MSTVETPDNRDVTDSPATDEEGRQAGSASGPFLDPSLWRVLACRVLFDGFPALSESRHWRIGVTS